LGKAAHQHGGLPGQLVRDIELVRKINRAAHDPTISASGGLIAERPMIGRVLALHVLPLHRGTLTREV
jgi:hypothetical protein